MSGRGRFKPLAERLADKYAPRPSGCWEWTGAMQTGRGYGLLSGVPRKYAHRVSYEVHRGPIPLGMCVCHRCDNPSCVNPDHLFLGTHAENMRDMARKGRAARAGAKLSRGAAEEIRRAVAAGEQQKSVAKRFGVGKCTVSEIVNGKRWAQ